MTRLLLVRHARPTENWDSAPDAGLDPLGHEQAAGLVDLLGGDAPRPVLTSPLRRARETAAPLASHWGAEPHVVPAVGEITAPHVDPADRVGWLRGVLAGTWSQVDDRLAAWRVALLDALTTLEQESIVFSHFVAINTAVGAATGDDRVMCFAPAHASVTELVVDDGALRLVARGAESDAPMPRAGGRS
ncbi:MAG TPA: histidine phosphatase family protein [Acidimicrobiia bacterium]|nr:histidine phosphatase family protein [Acidimicrobiia bacterium]